MIDGDSKDGNCEEVFLRARYKVNQEESEQDGTNKGADATGKVMHM